jgi:hypothetical protein
MAARGSKPQNLNFVKFLIQVFFEFQKIAILLLELLISLVYKRIALGFQQYKFIKF